jgi:hypothetical protein
MLESAVMLTGNTSIIKGAALCVALTPLLGCPQIVFGIPAAMRPEPRIVGSGPIRPDAEFVPLEFDLETEGNRLLFQLRVNGRSLEPTMGACRRWMLRRVARESEAARRSFCDDDTVRLHLEAGVDHTLELIGESEHRVAVRRFLRPGRNLTWDMPISTQPFELSVNLEPGHSYVVRAGEKDMDFSEALGERGPTGTKWDPDEHEPSYYSGVPVGSMTVRVLRTTDRRLASEVSVPLYSGHMKCQPPFCEAE